MKSYEFAIAVLLLLCCSIASAQTLQQVWQFKASDRVLASPVEKDGIVFIGDEQGVFYAIDAGTGKLKWKFESSGKIQAAACVTSKIVLFESANDFYALDLESGELKWKFDGPEPFQFEYESILYECKIDPFDDKRSVAIEHQGVLYVGTGWGQVLGFDPTDGSVVFQFLSDHSAPIRSTPLIENGKLYIGDWNGVVYRVDLKSKQTDWKKKTYRQKPYTTFGGVASSFATHNGLLFFGARNPMMNVLLTETGEKEWTYTDPEKGWIIGDPVIDNQTLFIGGSDNLTMYAFDTENGQRKWSHNGGRNIYTRPLLTKDWLLYTGGNAYDANDFGMLYCLNRNNGQPLSEFKTPKGIFSSPILVNQVIVFGCYDRCIYGLRIQPDESNNPT